MFETPDCLSLNERYYEGMVRRYSSLIWLLFAMLLLGGCQEQPAEPVKHEAWPNDAEVIFQDAAVLKYQIEQHHLEKSRLQELGVEGVPPRQ